jgi:chromatin remodeling complex protein RSC6
MREWLLSGGLLCNLLAAIIGENEILQLDATVVTIVWNYIKKNKVMSELNIHSFLSRPTKKKLFKKTIPLLIYCNTRNLCYVSKHHLYNQSSFATFLYVK